MASDPTTQTFAIIFANVPSNYTCKDIILNHLHSTNKKEITNKSYQRWLRAIRLIEFTSDTKCIVVFSSIYYWAKLSRLVLRQEKKLQVSITPKYYNTIEHAQNINLLSSNIQLYNISSIPKNIKTDIKNENKINIQPNIPNISAVSYTFIANNCVWITTKLPSEQELLIKIPSANISHAQIIENDSKIIPSENEENKNDHNTNSKSSITKPKCKISNITNECKYDSELILSLNKNCIIYEYYHYNKLWKCNKCLNINKIQSKNNMYCDICHENVDQKNKIRDHEITELLNSFNINNKPDLNKSKHIFIFSKYFYRKLTAFDTNSKIFNVLSPLFKLLNENRNILSTIMFTNKIHLTYKTLNIKMSDILQNNMNKIDIQMIHNSTSIEYKYIDFKLLQANLDAYLSWICGNNDRKPLTFPMLAKLLNFKNPAALSLNLVEYITQIETAMNNDAQCWLLKEAIEQSNINTNDLLTIVDDLEDHYEDKGVFDIEDANAKGPFIYELQLNSFSINIKQMDSKMLNMNENWNEMNKVSNDNYVISFEHMNNGLYDIEMKDLIRRMHMYSYLLFQSESGPKKCDIMHLFNRIDGFVQYGASILPGLFSDDKFLDYYKKELISNNNCDIEKENKFYDDEKYNINNNDIYYREPPMKKIKTNDEITLPIKNENMSKPKINKQITDIEMRDDMNKINGKRKHALIDSPESSPELTPVPKSFMKIKSPKLEAKPKPKPEPEPAPTMPKSFNKKFKNLEIINGVGWGFGVPIYNNYYWDCADFDEINENNMDRFAGLCLAFAIVRDLNFEKEMRAGRIRNIHKPNELQCGFIEAVPDEKYKQLFVSCFTTDDAMKLEMDLKDFCSDEILKKRKKRMFIIYDYFYGVRKDMVNRLNLLLRILQKHLVFGVIKIPVEIPAWYDMSFGCEAEELVKGFQSIDLTNVESDDDEEDDDYDVCMKENDKNLYGGNRPIRVKTEREFMSEDSDY